MAKPKGTIHRKFSDEEVRQIEVMGGLGMPLDQIAAIFDISSTTLDNRISDDPRIKRALEKGRAKASSKVRQTAFQMAISGENVAMTIFWLKVRERWKEPDVDPSKYSDAPISVSYDPNKRIEKKVLEASKPAVIEATATDRSLTDGKDGKDKK